MAREFPMPFGGISVIVDVSHQELPKALESLAGGCEGRHLHNFAVETDARVPRIWTTELGAECIKEALS